MGWHAGGNDNARPDRCARKAARPDRAGQGAAFRPLPAAGRAGRVRGRATAPERPGPDQGDPELAGAVAGIQVVQDHLADVFAGGVVCHRERAGRLLLRGRSTAARRVPERPHLKDLCAEKGSLSAAERMKHCQQHRSPRCDP